MRRVPLDFDFVGDTWPGYLMPESLQCDDCKYCDGGGYSTFARDQHDRWYGYVPFDPAETGSTRLTPETPAVRAFAERNVSQNAEFYAEYHPGPQPAVREAERLCRIWNGMWSHHLAQADVDALIAGHRLMNFTHTWKKGDGWQPIVPAPVVTAEQVNTWSLNGFGHDSINAMVVIEAACERNGQPYACDRCNGSGGIESYPGQREEAENWEGTGPPSGPGYQLWQTVSEGGPVSPVFATPEELADWIIASGKDLHGSNTPRPNLIRWIAAEGSSVGSFAITSGVMTSGVELAAGAS